jgi:hypothetical protein
MDPLHLELMQEMGGPGIVPGMMPGMYAPMNRGGASNLSAMSDPNNPYSPFNSFNRGAPIGAPIPDVSPLAPLNLQQYGIGGIIAGALGNSYLSNAMQQQGILPMGNAGSYMQAYRARDHLQMRQNVSSQLASEDAGGIYKTLRGGAAMAGMPFNEQQREAARKFSQNIAALGPTLAMVAPDFLDAISGEKGSVQVMASQMMEANRYRMDPVTGKMGYSADTNRDMVKDIFGTMFSKDNMARMQGLRAGDIGQMYKDLASEGLTGPTGSIREKTIRALQSSRESGTDLTALGDKVGVKIGTGTNLESLSDADLTKLRKDTGVQSKITQGDARQITDKLQSYVGSVSAMREVFGENGDPNAPMPKLINALRGLTSGQMQAFDANRLNTMVRDMQSMSQMSGKSVDQLVAMNQAAHQANAAALGPGFSRYGVQFDHASTRLGVAAGMSMAQLGGATGFGALNRQQLEQTVQQQYANSLNSEMFNAMGVATRLEKSGGFSDNEAGREMKSAMAALDAQQDSYTFVDDKGNSVTRRVPTRENDFRSLISRGAAKGVSTSDFNQMLADRTTNIRSMADASPERQGAVQAQQANELNQLIERTTANRFLGSDSLGQVQDIDQRRKISMALGTAATTATDNLTLEQLQDTKQRNRAIADAIKVEATNQGLAMTDEEAMRLADSSFGTRENVLQHYAGQDATSYAQTNSKRVRDNMAQQQSGITARAGVNQAMSGLGPKGSLLQRAATAIQKQGDRGEDANVNTLLGDMFGAGSDMAAKQLTPVMERIRERNRTIEEKTAQLANASPEDRGRLMAEIKKETAELEKDVKSARDIGDSAGLTDIEGKLNMADINKADRAARELGHLNRGDQARALAAYSEVTDSDLKAAADTKLTDGDLMSLAAIEQNTALKAADDLAAGDIANLPPEAKRRYDEMIAKGATEEAAREQIRKSLRAGVGSVEDQAKKLKDTFGPGMTVSDIKDQDRQKAIIRGRRAAEEINPKGEAVSERREEMRKAFKLDPQLTAEQRNKLSEEDRKTYDENERVLYKHAEDQLVAENQLRALGMLGEKENLMGTNEELEKLQKLDPALKEALLQVKPEDRAEVVANFIDARQMERFYGQDETEVEKKRMDARNQAFTAEGKQSASDTEQNLQALSELRREFLADDKAIARGGARSMEAVKKSKNAEQDLQSMANMYFGGDTGLMLSSGGVAMTAEGVEKADQEFAQLGADDKVKIAERLKAGGRDIGDPSKLSSANYKEYLAWRAKDAVQAMKDATDGLRGTAQMEYDDPELKGLSKGSITSLETMAKLDTADVKKDAEAIGVSEDDYRKMMRGEKEVDPSMKLFKDDKDKGTAADQLRVARADEVGLKDSQKRLAAAEKDLQVNPLSMNAQEEAKKLREDIQQRTASKTERMKSVGLDINKEEDVAKYDKLLDNQGKVEQLEMRRKQYMTERQKMKDEGHSDEAIEKKLGRMSDLEKEGQALAKEAQERDLGNEAMNVLADSFGEKEVDSRQKFKQKLEGGGFSSQVNKSTVASVLKQVGKLKIGDKDATAVEKLDILTDKYSGAKTEEERKKLASEYGLDSKELDRMMAQTEFLGMKDKKDKYTSDDMRKAMDKVGGRNIAEEVKKDEERTMRITGGTIQFVGDVNGKGTFSDVTAVGGR